MKVLSRRELNRALLARQMLLSRQPGTPLKAIERLAGMQAQEPRHPYVGLWSRLKDFRRERLTKLLHDRCVVRATAMRSTLHLLSTRDYASFRAPLQAALSSGMRSILGSRVNGVDFASLIERARLHFRDSPRTFDSLRQYLAAAHRGGDVRALAYAVRTHLPLVQVPVHGCEWGYPGVANFSPADQWLNCGISNDAQCAPMILRYLAAFGPASVADAQAWSGFKRLGPVFEELRPKLVTFTDDRGRELFDLPKAPRPAGDTPAPIRFVADYDNLVLSHADRSRIVADEHRKRVVMNNAKVLGTFLIGGFVAGTWKLENDRRSCSVIVKPFAPLARAPREQLAAEAELLLEFIAPAISRRNVKFQRG